MFDHDWATAQSHHLVCDGFFGRDPPGYGIKVSGSLYRSPQRRGHHQSSSQPNRLAHHGESPSHPNHSAHHEEYYELERPSHTANTISTLQKYHSQKLMTVVKPYPDSDTMKWLVRDTKKHDSLFFHCNTILLLWLGFIQSSLPL